VKVVIDLDLCEGHAKCQESAPDVFEVNDDDQSTLKVADIPEDQYDRVRRAAHDALRILDDHLTDQEIRGADWIVGGAHPSIADIACFPYVALAGDGGITIEDYGAIQRWIERVKQLPGFIDMPGIHPAS